ncbi:hypothetical protein REPUB_Repub16aG0028800 [Reevesia pubescens]
MEKNLFGERALTTEEVDHLERSTKKIKATGNESSKDSVSEPSQKSFKETLVWGEKDGTKSINIGNIEKIAFDFEDACIEDDDDMENND